MTFIEKWLRKTVSDRVTLEDLANFVSKGLEEGLDLDYKAIEKLERPDELSHHVASFANSAGGLLIVGVSENRVGNRTLPGEIRGTKKPKETVEWFQDVVLNKIQPPIPGVRIITVGSEKVGRVFLVEVPSSENPPHMANGRYYGRAGSRSLPMEHYQVADAFGKRRRPLLKPRVLLYGFRPERNSVSVLCQLTNDGRALAKWPLFRLEVCFCKSVDISPQSAMAEMFSREEAGDGVTTWYVAHLSERPMHSGITYNLGGATVNLGPVPALVTVSVGAEDCPTDMYVGLIGETWIRSNMVDRHADRVALPLVGGGPLLSDEGVRLWRVQYAGLLPTDFDFGGEFHKIYQQIMARLGVEFVTAACPYNMPRMAEDSSDDGT